MHRQSYDFQSGIENFDIKFPAGEALCLEIENPPEHGERVLTVGMDALTPPLIEIASTGQVQVEAGALEAIPEGRLCLFNIWQRDGQTLELIAEGRFVRRATIAPVLPHGPFTANASGPLLLFDGDSVMHNMPGTRVYLEQMVGHKFRFPEGYQNAKGGDSAQKVFFGAPEVASKIDAGNTVVLVGPIGANQSAADDSFEEITGYMDQVFEQYLTAGAVVIAVPTLLDGGGLTTQDSKKTALADWVMAYANGGTVSFDGVDHVLAAHEGFYAVDVAEFDRMTMKSDVSHPNALGAEFLASRLADLLLPLVHGDVLEAGNVENLLIGAEQFQGARPSEAAGVSGDIPMSWDVTRGEGADLWQGYYTTDRIFELSISDPAEDGTCVLTVPSVEIGAQQGDVVSFAAQIEILDGVSGLKSIGVQAQGQSPMTLDPEWALGVGEYNLRTQDLAYDADRDVQNFQIFVCVAAGANLTVKFHKAAAFFVENTSEELQLSGEAADNGTVGNAYMFSPTVKGGRAPYTFDLAGGALPSGLTLNASTGEISGVPTAAEIQQGIALRVTDDDGLSDVLPYFSIEITAAETSVTWNASLNTSAPFQLQYSDGDTVVSATEAINGIRHALGSNALLGKRYFEVSIGAHVLGVGVGTDVVTAIFGGSFGEQRCFWSGSFLFHTGGNTNMGAALVQDDIVQIAIDTDAGLIWMRRNGTGDWNNTVGSDPAAGIGGLDISGLSGKLYTYAGLQNNPLARATLVGVVQDFTYAAPAGFPTISG